PVKVEPARAPLLPGPLLPPLGEVAVGVPVDVEVVAVEDEPGPGLRLPAEDEQAVAPLLRPVGGLLPDRAVDLRPLLRRGRDEANRDEHERREQSLPHGTLLFVRVVFPGRAATSSRPVPRGVPRSAPPRSRPCPVRCPRQRTSCRRARTPHTDPGLPPA